MAASSGVATYSQPQVTAFTSQPGVSALATWSQPVVVIVGSAGAAMVSLFQYWRRRRRM
jgi:hypothetical protein